MLENAVGDFAKRPGSASYEIATSAAREATPVEILEDAIRHRIHERTAGQIQSLDVEVTGNRIIIRGTASCFYHKQLAVRGALDAISSPNEFQIELNVDVDTGSRGIPVGAASRFDEGD